MTRYLADKSALARLHLPAVREELEPLITRALVGICGVTELEMLFSARNSQERSRMKEQLEASMDRVDTPEDIWDQAAEIQEALTEQAQHRSASIPDLIVAATARVRGLEILHYDRDFDTIARYTEQPARWIVPPGTVLAHQARARLSGSRIMRHRHRSLPPDPGGQHDREPRDDGTGALPEFRLWLLAGFPAHAVPLGLPEPDLTGSGSRSRGTPDNS
jgi:predicted nucleic acid-binding protein